MDFKEKVKNCIARHELLGREHPVLVALSGGADSVALACVLQDLGYKIEAAHCNFCLRGAESDRDEAFVTDFCQRRKIVLHRRCFSTHAYAHEHHVSIEMAARTLRYDFFEQLLQERDLDCVAVAHHREDNTETVLLNLLRGTGIRGLRGIQYRNGKVVRPLLDVSRQEIEDYLAECHQDYVTDSTNLQDEVQRNKIRLNVMPRMREIYPNADESIHQGARRLSDAFRIYEYGMDLLMQQVVHGNKILLEELNRTPAPETVLYEILSRMDFNPAQVAAIYEQQGGESGKVYESPTHRLLRDREALVFEKKAVRPARLEKVLPLEGIMRVTDDVTFLISRSSYSSGGPLPREKNVICMDLDKVEFPLVVRTPQTGDRFMPFGMKGMKLVSDFLTDLKKNVFEKERQLLVCSGDKIAWVVGERPDDRFRVTEHTRHILRIQLL
ncbi:tRNA lysidine(34) synthetase TilS [Bacteroides sp. OF04-15BH]|uniref:tRNA lysidine(34) synthetase TilS n=1 Tax=Bacteroides sp. OF04-15BH TaxID=2292281 RepID=UPI000E51B5B0|nr:tRNA lysidine(34) synthetase TilS [Bacteroides sp. OF04-15BH]RHP66390.1 tRNA lysidine(34) synthetase TilS [Bacteroides sp. OF04-15BH]